VVDKNVLQFEAGRKLVLFLFVFVHGDAAWKRGLMRLMLEASTRQLTWSKVDNHQETANDRQCLEEVVLQEVTQRLVRWNGPPCVVVKIQNSQESDEDER
jgi:hypothetical protein